MLSYVVQGVDEPGPGRACRIAISQDSSVSSFASELSADRSKRLTANGTKHQALKRVSFGSSKGSMVETLVYESPVQEELETLGPATPFPADNGEQPETERSKVRVTFYQQCRPQSVPEFEPTFETIMATETVDGIVYQRQQSTDSGWDNPFRPGGDLSREADEIVELYKGGKPMTPTEPDQQHVVDGGLEPAAAKKAADAVQSAQNNNTANGSSKPGALEVQRANVGGQEASQAEHVVLKKKPKCKCCVIQ